jgi:Flp pilus assembly CpaE family ATPase
MTVISSNWNVEPRAWENIADLWNLLERAEKQGGRALEDYVQMHGQEAINEDMVKIFVKVYNNFLSEKQDPLVQLAESFPIYKQEKEILTKKEKPKVMIENLMIGHEENVIDNIREAADKILTYARANS